MPDVLPGSVQENLITMLCFDDANCSLISTSMPLEYFEGVYQEIASRAYLYIEKYKTAPKDHIADELADLLDEKNKQNVIYDRVLKSIYRLNEGGGLTTKYVMDSAQRFMKAQKLKHGLIDSHELVLKGDDDSLLEAERIISDALTPDDNLFDPGIWLNDYSRSLAFLDAPAEAFQTGIPAFDRVGVTPRRGELFLFAALPSRGKSWSLIHFGLMARLQGRNVCHITLEMSDDSVSKRYAKALFQIAERRGNITTTSFEMELVKKREKFKDLSFLVTKSRDVLNFEDAGIRTKLIDKMKKQKHRIGNLVIKQFPSGNLTMAQLTTFLDFLERQNKFIPDIILLDYIDLMKVGSDRRESIGNNTIALRGMAVERNVALVTATQINRAGMNDEVSLITSEYLAEDFSKVMTADTLITYNQTNEEKKLGLARLWVDKSRNDEDKFTVAISQHYPTGQFIVDSMRMRNQSRWEKVIEENAEDD